MPFFISPCTAMFHCACFGSAGRTVEHSPFAHMKNKLKIKRLIRSRWRKALAKIPLGPDSPRPCAHRVLSDTLWHSPLTWAALQDSSELAVLPLEPPLHWLSSSSTALRGTELAVLLCWGDPPTERRVSRLFVSAAKPTTSPLWVTKCVKVQIQFFSAYISVWTLSQVLISPGPQQMAAWETAMFLGPRDLLSQSC